MDETEALSKVVKPTHGPPRIQIKGTRDGEHRNAENERTAVRGLMGSMASIDRCAQCKSVNGHVCLVCNFASLDKEQVVQHQKRKDHFGGHYLVDLERFRRRRRCPQRYQDEDDVVDAAMGAHVEDQPRDNEECPDLEDQLRECEDLRLDSESGDDELPHLECEDEPELDNHEGASVDEELSTASVDADRSEGGSSIKSQVCNCFKSKSTLMDLSKALCFQ